MKFPGILPLVFFLFLVPALTPIIQQFWPTSTTWWSAILVAVLGAASSAIWLVYRRQLAKADMPPPGVSADVAGSTWDKQALRQTTWRNWLLG
jgi:hypothetical protein